MRYDALMGRLCQQKKVCDGRRSRWSARPPTQSWYVVINILVALMIKIASRLAWWFLRYDALIGVHKHVIIFHHTFLMIGRAVCHVFYHSYTFFLCGLSLCLFSRDSEMILKIYSFCCHLCRSDECERNPPPIGKAKNQIFVFLGPFYGRSMKNGDVKIWYLESSREALQNDLKIFENGDGRKNGGSKNLMSKKEKKCKKKAPPELYGSTIQMGLLFVVRGVVWKFEV